MASQRLSKRVRLLTASDFERVFSARASASDSWLVLYGAANTVGYARLGLTVPRRVGSAVERNRWKRLLREAFRLGQHELPPIDYVCVPRSTAAAGLRQLMESFPALAQRVAWKLRPYQKACQPADSAPSGELRPPAIDTSP